MEVLIKAIKTHRTVRKSSAMIEDDGRHFDTRNKQTYVKIYEKDKLQWFNKMTTDYKVIKTIYITSEIEYKTVKS